MYINSRGHGGISVASHHPLGAVVHISETEGERGEFRTDAEEERRLRKQGGTGERRDKAVTRMEKK